jgi:uncharacterized membrane protein YphA (DoxX/SURF4 family)
VTAIFAVDAQSQKTVASMRALPRGLWAFLGAFECLAGLCRILPVLTPIAAAAVAAESVVISAFDVYYRDLSPMIHSVAMGDHGGVHFLWTVRAAAILRNVTDAHR